MKWTEQSKNLECEIILRFELCRIVLTSKFISCDFTLRCSWSVFHSKIIVMSTLFDLYRDFAFLTTQLKRKERKMKCILTHNDLWQAKFVVNYISRVWERRESLDVIVENWFYQEVVKSITILIALSHLARKRRSTSLITIIDKDVRAAMRREYSRSAWKLKLDLLEVIASHSESISNATRIRSSSMRSREFIMRRSQRIS